MENKVKSKTGIYQRVIILILAVIGWFGLALPSALSYNNDLVVIAGIGITLFVVIPMIVMSIKKIIKILNEEVSK